ncbi:MAG TPA: peptide-methionine (R)-S-oxide reductase MsrB [Caulobacteraceae bacterium]|nr:peptide-methionine (R)-S-oxide reductase MsrB [Caulobacteraceae bacterium]
MSVVRRSFLLGSAGTALSLMTFGAEALAARVDRFAASPWRKITNAEWKKRLSPASYHILREDGTERAGTSPLLNEHRKGTFVCIACGLPLFKSQWKFESGTGWPSFYNVIPGSIYKKSDHALLEERTEYHCAQCLGHQGHLFDDGPKPTGLRYCNDGVALRFIPG